MANLCQRAAFQVRFLKELCIRAGPRRSVSAWRMYLSMANKESTRMGHFRPTLTQVRSYQIRDVPEPAKPDSPEKHETSEGDASAAGQPLDKQVEELLASIETYKTKLSVTEEKYKRQLAETENVRQRFTRQVEEAKAFGIQNFCKDLLEIADVLELATESVPKDALTKENAALKQLYDGLVMTQTQMSKIFNKHGLVAVRPLGEKFNPNVHEAVFQVKDDTKEAGSIANVVKIGYLLHDRLIRPAKVGVYISS